jgi:hypothetical protein
MQRKGHDIARCTIGGQFIAAGLSTTAIAAVSMSRTKYTQRLAEAGIEPSVGSVGDSYDNFILSVSKGLWPRRPMAFTRPR